MDPYRILGLSRDCTREAVKAAFRARVWQAHPDRGGDAEAFIQICTAYKRILHELERRSRAADLAAVRSPRRARPAARPAAPRAPEFLVFEDPPGWNRPPTPPDPNWEPDLVLGDEGPLAGRGPEPVPPRSARRTYVSWLRQVAAAQPRRSIRRSAWFRALGIVVLLGLVGGNLWLCWVAWTYDPKEAAREAGLRATVADRPESGLGSGP
jgi:DnaJ-like protein